MEKSIERVTGIKKFKGEVDGKGYDSTTVYIETRLDDRKGTMRGECTQDYQAGTSAVYDGLTGIELPGDFEVEWETISNGKTTKRVIAEIRPASGRAKVQGGPLGARPAAAPAQA